MKKLYTLLLICLVLILTSCNEKDKECFMARGFIEISPNYAVQCQWYDNEKEEYIGIKGRSVSQIALKNDNTEPEYIDEALVVYTGDFERGRFELRVVSVDKIIEIATNNK